MTTRLPEWHYTCEHMAPWIIKGGSLLPPADNPRRKREPTNAAQGSVVWVTDLARPAPPEALGLHRVTLQCDRTVHRFRVLDPTLVIPYLSLERDLRRAFGAIETSPGARPRHWWLTDEPLPVVYDPLPGTPALG